MINCSSRSEHTCPGEMSKSWRLLELARGVFEAAPNTEVKVLDLSRLTSEYGRHIHPLQGLLLDGGGALPLALLLLPEPFPWVRSRTS
ncbi:hypothetical protein [Phenylobacterium sp. J367]|uniref:hypothetical protein n=1 Tax=Phenylobacterium sp. J367 TaxID=2898435 RepID=UPI0021508636|nr:hypothetical protein [Phenylobacterium sp. J367]MCR5878577.1 hypothetical protein [Phenylobacterium sp. J367]